MNDENKPTERKAVSFTPTEQQAAILAHEANQHARVLAGPGTGKSATLVALVSAIRKKASDTKVRMLTFTRAATAELAKRISDDSDIAAELPSTVHSFAIGVLLRNPGAAGLPEPLRIADDWEEKKVLRPTLAKRAVVTQRMLNKLIRELAANWESLEERHEEAIEPSMRNRFLGAWAEHREILGYTLLSELPFALRTALRDHPDLAGVDYHLLVVDEYQDLNPCDLDVLKRLADRGCRIIGVGDDDQSIYSWRNAAPAGIRRFLDDYPGAADYPLSIAQRCGRRILEWATSVIEADVDRPRKARMAAADHCPDGEMGLLSFASQAQEARGIAELVLDLVSKEGIAPDDVLILLRSDHLGSFSTPIKNELNKRDIASSNPEAYLAILGAPANRKALELLRLLSNEDDSLAWASLCKLTPGLGDKFFGSIYELARENRLTFAGALRQCSVKGIAQRASKLVSDVEGWRKDLNVPSVTPEGGWGAWIVSLSGVGRVPELSDDFKALLQEVDQAVERDISLGRYLNQISPIVKDRALARRGEVRIMTMAGAKGLTVEATIVAALENGVMPRPNVNLAEERRLLYVAMTRARRFLFGTWARQRVGPTARAGQPRVASRRSLSDFLTAGPVQSEDGPAFLKKRFPADSDSSAKS